MSLKKVVSLLLVLCLTIGLLVTVSGCNKPQAESAETEPNDVSKENVKVEKMDLVSGWTPSGAVWYLYGASAMQEIQSKIPGLSITVQETAGTSENYKRLKAGTIDIGLMELSAAYQAYTGTGKFEGQEPIDNMRMMTLTSPGLWQWVVTVKSGIETVQDLDGEKFNPGPVGGGSESGTVKIFEDILNIKPDYYKATSKDAVEAVKNGQIVGFTYRGQNSPMITELNAVRPVKILSLTDEEIDRITSEMKGIYPGKLPAGSYEGMDEVNTLSVWTGIAVSSEVPEDVVYEMTKAYWESIDAIAQTLPHVTQASPELTVEYSSIPIHPGAAKYYQEIGIEVPAERIK